jgi:alkylresorcinol/alkylpyrone synthase
VGQVTTIAAVHGVLGAHRYAQTELTELFTRLCLPDDDRAAAVARRLHTSTSIATRHLALPLERYPDLGGFTEANDAFLSVAVDLGAQAVAGALKEAELDVGEVDLIMSTTVTGIAVPSLDARIAIRLGLRPDVRRVPLMGLGCAAGAAGLARVHDYLRGAPDAVAVLVSVELCSLTVQRDDPSVANMMASGLFGDGAAAVVLTGADREVPGPRIVSSRSHLYPDTERALGLDVGTGGLRIVLGAEVPDLVRQYLAGDVAALLGEHELTVADIDPWICHTGGPKVIEAIEDALDLPPDALALTWQSLREVGNLSSASVLHILRDTMTDRPADGDGWGVLLAMGPGFGAELVLLRW